MAGVKGSGCGGPIGNKHGLGAEGTGRPGRDLDALSKELITWSQLETSINLCEFCGDRLLSDTRYYVYVDTHEAFREAHLIAKQNIGKRREQKLNAGLIHTRAYETNKTCYDLHARKELRDQQAYEASLKAQETLQGTEEQNKKIDEVLGQIKSLQKPSRSE